MANLSDLAVSLPTDNVVSVFSRWMRWSEGMIEDVDGHPLRSYSGVYVLAHFAGPPPRGPASPIDPRIIYVGEGSVLGKRWYQFERSIGGKPNHSAGHEYRRRFDRTTPSPSLCVAAFPIWLKKTEPDVDATEPHSLTCRLRLHLEQAILWHLHVRKRGGELLNRK